MIKTVQIDVFGLTLHVELDVAEDEHISIECVRNVYAEIPQGHLVELKCDTTRFYNDLEGEIYRALENAMADEKIAAYEMKMDARKEEGL